MTKRNIVSTLFSITGLLILTKLLGFVRQMIVARAFGATLETDLINLSQGLIGNIHYVLQHALTTSFISVYIGARELKAEQAKRFAFQVLKAFTILTAAAALLVFALSPLLARLIAPSYSAESSAVLSGYLRLYSPFLILFVYTAVFGSLLNAEKDFIPNELVGFWQSAITIAVVWLLGSKQGPKVLITAFVLYTVWNVLYLGFLSQRSWGLCRGNPFRDEQVKKLLRMMAPLLLGYSLVYVNQLVDKILVTGLEDGAVTALGYGAVLSNLISTFIVTFGSVLFSYVTTCIAQGRDAEAAELSHRASLLLIMLFLPISVVSVLLSEEIVTVAFARGAFDARAVRQASQALKGYAFTFVPLVLREVYSRIQYGYQDAKRPMINSSIGIAANIALSILLCPRCGVFGVSFASSVSVLICGVLNMISAQKLNAHLRFFRNVRELLWIAAAGAASVGLCILGRRVFGGLNPVLLFLLVSALACGGCYLLVSPLLWKYTKGREGIFRAKREPAPRGDTDKT